MPLVHFAMFYFVSDGLSLKPHSQMHHFKQPRSASRGPPKSTGGGVGGAGAKELRRSPSSTKALGVLLRFIMEPVELLQNIWKVVSCSCTSRALTKLSSKKSVQKERINKDELNCKCIC